MNKPLPWLCWTLLVLLCAACATSPLGRSQLLLFPEEEIAAMGAASFDELKQQTPPGTDASTNRYVQCVSDHVIRALGESPSQWEVRVFDDPSVNAFALPGRKIGVYTGLLDVTENQHQLATVIGHEIAHVEARHGNERVSTSSLTQGGLSLLQIVTGTDTPLKRQALGLLGVGAQYGVILPFGRAQETEADLIGLDLMADAGFDPRESVRLWQNMARASGGQRPPEFLSTHPSSDTRISRLNARMGDAMARSLAARNAGRNPDCR